MLKTLIATPKSWNSNKQPKNWVTKSNIQCLSIVVAIPALRHLKKQGTEIQHWSRQTDCEADIGMAISIPCQTSNPSSNFIIVFPVWAAFNHQRTNIRKNLSGYKKPSRFTNVQQISTYMKFHYKKLSPLTNNTSQWTGMWPQCFLT